MSIPLIQIEGLHFAYPNLRAGAAHPPALRDIYLSVAAGECVAIMGANGSGKTTLCLALNGLVPHVTGGTFHGNVWVCGHNTRTTAVATLATQVGLVFQEAENQLCTLRVEDEVAFGLENLGLPVDEIERRVTWALEAVGLNHLRSHPPAQLSGGQQQRLALAAVLAMQPTILVLDEPTGGLDPIGRQEVLEVLMALRRQGSTIVMATQDAEAVAMLADRVIVLHEGAIALEGTPRTVFGQVTRLQELGVGVPQLCELSDLLGNATPWLTLAEALAELRPIEERRSKDERLGSLPRHVARRAGDTGAAVHFENVGYCYASGVQALRTLNLRLETGEYVALLGANGSGKTTLARHISGLLRPQHGRVVVLGQDTRRASPGTLARYVGHVFQNPDHQIFAPTVWEEVAFGPRNLGWDAKTVRQRVTAALERFQLNHLADVPPTMLSFGLRRQVTLAAVEAMQPQVLVLDEPTLGLDHTVTEGVMAWVTESHATGRTVVFITHHMTHAVQAARWIALQAGTVVLDASPEETLIHEDTLAHAGLAPPPVVTLALRLGLRPLPLTVADMARRIGTLVAVADA